MFFPGGKMEGRYANVWFQLQKLQRAKQDVASYRMFVLLCRELGVDWGVLQQWQDRAMEGMLMALQPRLQLERGAALSLRLAVLLKKSQAGMMKRLDKRLKKMQGDPKSSQELREAVAEKKL